MLKMLLIAALGFFNLPSLFETNDVYNNNTVSKNSEIIEFDGNETESNVVNQVKSLLNVVLLLDNMRIEVISNMKYAAASLLRSIINVGDLQLSVFSCGSLPIRSINMVELDVAESFILSSLTSDDSYIMQCYSNAIELFKSGGTSRGLYIVTSNMSHLYVRNLAEAMYPFNNLSCNFVVYQIHPLEGYLHIYYPLKVFLYYLPKFKVPFGTVQNAWNAKIGHLYMIQQMVENVEVSYETIFVIVAMLEYKEESLNKDIKLRNIEFDQEWMELDPDLEHFFPSNDQFFLNIRVYLRIICEKCRHRYKLIRMNDHGLSPDLVPHDFHFSAALYCDDFEVLGVYDTEFIILDIGNSIAKIIDGKPFVVTKMAGACSNDVIKPASIGKLLNVFLVRDTIYCIFVAVGNDGMTKELNYYEINFTTSGLRYHSFICNMDAAPFSISCCMIDGSQLNYTQSIFLQIQGIDEADNAADWSQWSQSTNPTYALRMCRKTLAITEASATMNHLIRLFSLSFFLQLFHLHNY